MLGGYPLHADAAPDETALLGADCRQVATQIREFLAERPSDDHYREANQTKRLLLAQDEELPAEMERIMDEYHATTEAYEERFAGKVYPIVNELRRRGDLTESDARKLNNVRYQSRIGQVVYVLERMARRMGG